MIKTEGERATEREKEDSLIRRRVLIQIIIHDANCALCDTLTDPVCVALGLDEVNLGDATTYTNAGEKRELSRVRDKQGRMGGEGKGALTKRVNRVKQVVSTLRSGHHELRDAAGSEPFLSVWFGNFAGVVSEDKGEDYVSKDPEMRQ